MKPLLLLDVDGPLNPYAAKPTQRPEGYRTFRYSSVPHPHWTPDRSGMRVWLNPGHGPLLLSLADRFDLAWATSWEHEANLLIGPAIGLPELPVVEFPRPRPRWDPHSESIWKMDTVLEYVGERPFAWLDDDFTLRDLEWSRQREIPTRLMPIRPDKGILPQDIDALAAWHRDNFGKEGS